MINKVVLDSGCATVYLEGRLDFTSYPDFRGPTAPLLEEPEVSEIRLDMAALDYLDSSALGMILLLNQKARAAGKRLAISRPSPSIAGILKVMNFGGLLPILP